MNNCKNKSLCRGLISFPVISSPQMKGYNCIDSNAKSNSNCIDEILNWVNQ